MSEIKPVAWVPIHPKHGNLWTMTTNDPNRERLPHEYPLAPLYTHPANVAALEERITELAEAEQLARADAEASKAREKVLEEALRNVRLSIEQADPKVLCCTLWMAKLPETVVDYIDASLTREGGV